MSLSNALVEDVVLCHADLETVTYQHLLSSRIRFFDASVHVENIPGTLGRSAVRSEM